MSVEIQYYSRLYLGDGITEQKLDKIKKRLAKRPVLAGVHLLALSRNGIDQLDIFESRMLSWPYYRQHPPLIIGIALSHEEAVGLVEKMAAECWNARGDCALREYLLC